MAKQLDFETWRQTREFMSPTEYIHRFGDGLYVDTDPETHPAYLIVYDQGTIVEVMTPLQIECSHNIGRNPDRGMFYCLLNCEDMISSNLTKVEKFLWDWVQDEFYPPKSVHDICIEGMA